MSKQEVTVELAGGKRLVFETGRMAKQASGAALVTTGETVVLAGPSGAGKSTVIEILLGFVRPDSGRVVINGRDITDLVPQALSAITAWIGQRPVLFAGTIRENILFARPGASEAEFNEAIRASRVDGFVSNLPDGIETRVGEGGYGLSGGQAQRIAIARALITDPRILILDEATSALDYESERAIQQNMNRISAGRTVFVIAHRLSTVRNANRIITLEHGRIVEDGSHDELIR